ncbi:DNA-directed RNA polymerase subunit L [Candidatus Woesearchaeota archaeon]|nr:DNA-directed RNA polymerase subunit L [Candidatus Woesearchaeota archaeon]MBW2994068.1 DNA-directed RNA polymerase subunit L [Candidatus Woesearchaeota archaeon]
MEVNIIEEKKNKLVFEIPGEGHTLCNALQKELWTDSHVKVAGYNIAHPLINVPKFTLETDGADPKKTISAAVKRLTKVTAKIKDQAKKIK